MKINTVLKLTLSAALLALLTACSDTKESLTADMKELKTECNAEAKELKEAEDAEGLEELMKECNEKGKALDEKMKALVKEEK